METTTEAPDPIAAAADAIQDARARIRAAEDRVVEHRAHLRVLDADDQRLRAAVQAKLAADDDPSYERLARKAVRERLEEAHELTAALEDRIRAAREDEERALNAWDLARMEAVASDLIVKSVKLEYAAKRFVRHMTDVRASIEDLHGLAAARGWQINDTFRTGQWIQWALAASCPELGLERPPSSIRARGLDLHEAHRHQAEAVVRKMRAIVNGAALSVPLEAAVPEPRTPPRVGDGKFAAPSATEAGADPVEQYIPESEQVTRNGVPVGPLTYAEAR